MVLITGVSSALARLLVTCSTLAPSADVQPSCDCAHRRLLAAAKDGRSDDAEAALQEMAVVGLEPGPRAYHGLICAYCRARNSQGALSAVRRAVQEGGQQLCLCTGPKIVEISESKVHWFPGSLMNNHLACFEGVFLVDRFAAYCRDVSCADACANGGWRQECRF